MENCEICGKHLDNHKDIFHLKGKTMCYDCAYAKKCNSCGKLTPASNLCYIGTTCNCFDCMFAGGKSEYDLFIKKLKEFNDERKKEHNLSERKRRIKVLIWGTIAFVLAIIMYFFIPLLFELLFESVPRVINVFLGGVVSGSFFGTLAMLHKKAFTEIGESDFYYDYWNTLNRN